jgi:hypothetical protein
VETFVDKSELKYALNQSRFRAEPKPFSAYVSVIDVLGFSQLLDDADPVWVYHNVVCLLRDTACRARTYYSERAAEYDSEISKCGGWEHSTPPIRSMFFADTLILYVAADASWGRVPRVALYTMTNVLSALLSEGLRHRLLLRGAMSFGTILVDEASSTILGRPVI